MSGERFVSEGIPSRVRFGTVRLAEPGQEVEYLGARRVLLIAGRAQREHADRAAADLGALLADRVDAVRPHVPLLVAESRRSLAAGGLREDRVEAVARLVAEADPDAPLTAGARTSGASWSGRWPARPPRLDSGLRHAKRWLSHMRALCERGSAWMMWR